MGALTKSWHTESSVNATSKQATQYGIRTPDGIIHWGDLTLPHQPAQIVLNGLSWICFTDPPAEVDQAKTIVGLRGRMGDALRNAFVPEDEVVQHVLRTVRVSRTVFIGFGETTEVE
jgi:hypothetical protein